MKTEILNKNYGSGNNSRRVLIKERGKKYLLKITDTKEIGFLRKYVPKLYSINGKKYKTLSKDNCDYVYKYQFIPGRRLNRVCVTDKLFLELIKMFRYFSHKNCLVWDCHPSNIIVSKGYKVFFVDLGGISEIPMQSFYYPIIFREGVEPDEWKYGPYPESIRTEQFTIFYLSNRLLKECRLKLSSKAISILEKMNEMEIAKRYKTFDEIYKAIKSSKTKKI